MKPYLQDMTIAITDEETGIFEFVLQRYICKKKIKSQKAESYIPSYTCYISEYSFLSIGLFFTSNNEV